MSTFPVDIRTLESPVDALTRVAGELLTDLTEQGGGLILITGPLRIGADTFLAALIEHARSAHAPVIECWADTDEVAFPLSYLERLTTAQGAPSAPDFRAGTDDPARTAALTTEWFEQFATADSKASTCLPIVSIAGAQAIDAASARALRYAIPRLMHRGIIFIVGTALGGLRELPELLERTATIDPQGRLVLLPTLRELDVQRHFAHRFGFTLGADAARYLIVETAGLLGAVDDVFDEITPLDLEAIRATRHMPSEVYTRVAALTPYRGTVAPEELRIFEEICAVAGDPVPRQVFARVAQRLGVLERIGRAMNGTRVVQIPASGDFCLRVPRERTRILDAADPARIRVIRRAMADAGFGNVAAHRVWGAERVDAEVAAHALAEARILEAGDAPRLASEVIRAADLRSEDPAQALAMLGEGIRMHIRHMLVFQTDNFVQRLDELPDQVEAEYLRLWVDFLSPRGEQRGHPARLAFAYEPSSCDDHRWMRLDIATLDAIAAFTDGQPTEFDASAAIARRILDDVDEPVPNCCWWLSREGSRLILDALDLSVRCAVGEVTVAEIPVRAAALAARARLVPDAESDVFDALAVCAGLEFAHGGFDRCLAYSAEAVGHLDRSRSTPFFEGFVAEIRAFIALQQGDWDAADAILDAILPRVFDFADPQARRVIPIIASYLASARGEFDRAETLLEIARHDTSSSPHSLGLDEFIVVAEGEFAMHTEGFERVLEVMEEYAAMPRYADSFGIYMFRAEAFAALGQPIDARAAYERAVEVVHPPFSELSSFLDHAEGAVLRAEGDLDGSTDAFRRGIEHARSPLERAKCELALASNLGDTFEAWELADAAERRLHEIGAVPYLRFSRALRSRMDQNRQQRVEHLTNRERQVAELASRYWTNPEIARELNVSRSTVAFHISRVLDKLDIASRKDIAAALRGSTSETHR